MEQEGKNGKNRGEEICEVYLKLIREVGARCDDKDNF